MERLKLTVSLKIFFDDNLGWKVYFADVQKGYFYFSVLICEFNNQGWVIGQIL